ncbi:16S rRNA C1402 (ribose-2'-O) methylase RsmI [Allocatelliglobosispora scoriae]|uniref:16S rRNA C1402 (Ribose-2'-O) methylase RsmI n=1 Tax=Allocatelliglobosispora scoriae TaxID=643052 RepID=A0A841BFQ8_9ACTN|nr:hypothetical protein [Allocatelliglobosispora scoriae]MBB5867124.1 16S rRNA C1402 (ribose-2'-O) methylase RsmI [Allocatelliglobosispora scoriae]
MEQQTVPPKARELIADGDLDLALSVLRRHSFTLADAVETLRDEAGLRYGDALQQIWAHPDWHEESVRARAVLDSFWSAFEQVAVISDDGTTWVVDPDAQ